MCVTFLSPCPNTGSSTQVSNILFSTSFRGLCVWLFGLVGTQSIKTELCDEEGCLRQASQEVLKKVEREWGYRMPWKAIH